MKKIISLLVLAVLVLAGCSSSTDDEQVTINYMTFSVTADQEPVLKQIIEQFETENPTINVEYQIVGYNDYFTKLQTDIAAKNAADVFELNYENSVTFNEKGALLPLGDLISDNKTDLTQFNEPALNAFSDADGNQFGIVSSFSTVVTYYNKDLFDQAGVDYPTTDWTWKDEYEAAQTIKEKTGIEYGMIAPTTFNEFYKVAAQNGGTLFNADYSEPTINSQANIDSLQYMVDLIDKYDVNAQNLAPDEDTDLFKQAKTPMLTTGSWMLGAFADVPFNWDIVVEPGNTQKASHFFANGLAINSETQQAEAAYKFIEFYTTNADVISTRIENGLELPATKNTAAIEEFTTLGSGEDRSMVFKSLDNIALPPTPASISFNELADVVDAEVQAAKLNQKTPKQALDDAQAKIEELINQ